MKQVITGQSHEISPAIISENDLINFLRYRQDIYAILDVTDPEFPMADSVLLRHGKCIIVSSYSRFYGTRTQKAWPVYGGTTPKIFSWYGTTHWQVNREHLTFSI